MISAGEEFGTGVTVIYDFWGPHPADGRRSAD
jgi:hypothetical protein